MKRGLLLVCWLVGCVVDTSLGEHHARQPSVDPASEEHAQQEPAAGADAAVHETPAATEPAPSHEPAAQPEPSADPPAADAPAPPASEPAPPDMDDTPSEHPPADPPMQEPPPAEMPPAEQPAPPPVCDVATDNPCLLCDQDACCEPRHACLENADCACHLECRSADNPATCREGCGAMGDRYEPWLLCLQQHCADHCAL